MAGGERNAHIFCLIRRCAGREEGEGGKGEGGKLFYCVRQELKEKKILRKNNYNILPCIPNPNNCVVQLTTTKCVDKS